MTTTHDPLATLSAHRPQSSTWTPEGRAATLANLLVAASAGETVGMPGRTRVARSRPGRRRLALVGVAAAAALVIGAPLVTNRTSPSAAAVEQLVSSAQRSAALVIPVGKYLHQVTVENPDGPPAGAVPEQGGDYPRTLESWTDSAGMTWRRDSTASGSVDYLQFDLPGAQSVNTPSPAFAATFPTDASRLETFLRERVSGSSSPDEAVFVAVGDFMRLGYVPSAVRAAAVQVLANLPEVTATKTTLAGVDVTRIDFVDESIRAGMTFSLYFDSATASLVKDQQSFRGEVSFTSVVSASGLVASVPSVVVDTAAMQAAAEEKYLRECNGANPAPDCATRPKP